MGQRMVRAVTSTEETAEKMAAEAMETEEIVVDVVTTDSTAASGWRHLELSPSVSDAFINLSCFIDLAVRVPPLVNLTSGRCGDEWYHGGSSWYIQW